MTDALPALVEDTLPQPVRLFVRAAAAAGLNISAEAMRRRHYGDDADCVVCAGSVALWLAVPGMRPWRIPRPGKHHRAWIMPNGIVGVFYYDGDDLVGVIEGTRPMTPKARAAAKTYADQAALSFVASLRSAVRPL